MSLSNTTKHTENLNKMYQIYSMLCCVCAAVERQLDRGRHQAAQV